MRWLCLAAAQNRVFSSFNKEKVAMKKLGASSIILWAVCASAAVVAQSKLDGGEQAIRERFSAFPQLQIDSIAPGEVQGLYKVQLLDGPVVYASPDGKHFLLGEVFELRGDGLVNLAEEARDAERGELMAQIDPADAIVFAATGDRKATLTVFTDVDCFYCQKLHEEIASYTANGIEVRYLAFPRKGVSSDTYEKMVSAWCSKDQRASLTLLKQQKAIPQQQCENPVAEHYALGQAMGIRGTPALILESGRMLPGYVSANDLVPMLEIENR